MISNQIRVYPKGTLGVATHGFKENDLNGGTKVIYNQMMIEMVFQSHIVLGEEHATLVVIKRQMLHLID